MTADYIYTSGKLGEAVTILATHPGRIKDRLIEATHHALVMVNPKVFEGSRIHVDAASYWQRIWAAVTKGPQDPVRGLYAPSIESLSEAEAKQVAQLIVSLDAMMDGISEQR